jgi:hypothetical protein
MALPFISLSDQNADAIPSAISWIDKWCTVTVIP